MFSSKFGIEIEMTGITRERAAKVIAEHFGTEAPRSENLRLSGREVKDRQGRKWKVVRDSSIRARRKVRGEYVSASNDYQVELVSPPLRYREDIEDLQELVRKLRRAGATAAKGTQCGIHIHLDGAPHTARSLSNFVKIIAAKEDLLYGALDFDPARQHWCRKTDRRMLERLERAKPRTLAEMRRVWYGSEGAGAGHYHDSRYTFLNLLINSLKKSISVYCWANRRNRCSYQAFYLMAIPLWACMGLAARLHTSSCQEEAHARLQRDQDRQAVCVRKARSG